MGNKKNSTRPKSRAARMRKICRGKIEANRLAREARNEPVPFEAHSSAQKPPPLLWLDTPNQQSCEPEPLLFTPRSSAGSPPPLIESRVSPMIEAQAETIPKKICRLCLMEGPPNVYFSIMEKEIPKMLKSLTSIRVDGFDDDSISWTCMKCYLNLKLAYNIQQNILRADERIRNEYIPGINNDMEPDIVNSIKEEWVSPEALSSSVKSEVVNIDASNETLHKPHNKSADEKLCCEVCGKIMKRRQYYIHIKKHMGVKNYICDTCGKSFFTGHAMNKHINGTHMKLRPFICQHCKKAFSSRYAMRVHLRQHTNETPYKCSICEVSFRHNISLKTHKKSKHNVEEELTAACDVCGKHFASEHAVVTHRRLHFKNRNLET